jgi:hypothetical protein
MPPKKAKATKAKPTSKPTSKSASKPAKSAPKPKDNSANTHEGPLISRAENAQEILEIKQKRDALIARDPNNSKWVESAHMACMGLFKCYKSGERNKCLNDIHSKLDALAKSK